MTESEEEKKLEARLENWGRWLREGKHVGVSSLWSVLQRLPKPKEPMDSSFTVGGDIEPVPPIFEKDALKVQRAWNQLPRTTLQDQEARALIGAIYAYQGYDMRRILYFVSRTRYTVAKTPIRIRERDVEALTARARTMMRNILRRLDEAS